MSRYLVQFCVSIIESGHVVVLGKSSPVRTPRDLFVCELHCMQQMSRSHEQVPYMYWGRPPSWSQLLQRHN